ncbi:hypothetical protein CKJ89_38005, partial [Klebsiella pneumoniae]
VALPQQGWDCDGLAATIAQTAPRLAWLMPDFTTHRTLYGCPTRQRVALPQQGWDCDGLAATIAQTAPRLAWLMPDFT